MTARMPSAERSDSVGTGLVVRACGGPGTWFEPVVTLAAVAFALTASFDRGFFEVRHRSRITVEGNNRVDISTVVVASPSAEGGASLG
tara:strand:+ start:175 stop:438 length:264 start_codon:yes stop_codon:yes gene_type:complete